MDFRGKKDFLGPQGIKLGWTTYSCPHWKYASASVDLLLLFSANSRRIKRFFFLAYSLFKLRSWILIVTGSQAKYVRNAHEFSFQRKSVHLNNPITPRPSHTSARLLPADRINKYRNFTDEWLTAHSHIISIMSSPTRTCCVLSLARRKRSKFF